MTSPDPARKKLEAYLEATKTWPDTSLAAAGSYPEYPVLRQGDLRQLRALLAQGQQMEAVLPDVLRYLDEMASCGRRPAELARRLREAMRSAPPEARKP